MIKQRRRRYGLREIMANAKVANEKQVDYTEKSENNSDDSK